MGLTAAILILVGLVGLLATLFIVYNPLNKAWLSMSVFNGDNIKEHHHGLSWKWPWFLLQGLEIDMRASIIITSGGILVMPWDKFISEGMYKKIEPQIYETKDGVLYGSWATAISPLAGGLRTFFKKTPQVGALMTLAKINLFVSDLLAKKDTETALGEKGEISKELAGLFLGEHRTSDHEESYGIDISDPMLFDLNYGKRMQDAAEKRFEAKEFRKAMEDMMAKVQTDPDKASDSVLIATGMAKKNIFHVQGLEAALKGMAEAFASRRGS